jgi:putative membrane protein
MLAAMTHHIIHLLVFAVAVLLTAKVVPGIRVKSFGSAVFFAFVLAVLNKLLFNLLVFLSFPMIVLSLGLFLLVINAFLWILADKLSSGVEIDGFGSAILGSIVTSIINFAILWIVR